MWRLLYDPDLKTNTQVWRVESYWFIAGVALIDMVEAEDGRQDNVIAVALWTTGLVPHCFALITEEFYTHLHRYKHHPWLKAAVV